MIKAGWYRTNVRGGYIPFNHYFFDSEKKSICGHCITDNLKEPSKFHKKCSICVKLIETYKKIGLENRCIG